MVSENIVRDRTLVLRVLVPGLHTQLSDKLLAKQEGADSTSSSNDNTSNNPSASSGGNNNSSSSSSAADQILNLEGVTCLPSSAGSTLWHFRCDGATYPARLVNLPCPVEVHKTHDHATYHKSADIGQMLIVYEDEYAMEEAENEKGYKIEGFPSYYHSGLSPPLKRVVQRRFRARFEERESKAIPPPHKEVSEVEKEIQGLIAKLSSKPGKLKGRGRGGGSSAAAAAAASSSTVTTKEKVIEEVEDEIVDYEPWMESGKIYTIEDAKKHPEWWLTKDEMKEIETAKKAEEDEKQRKAEKAQEKKKRKEEKKKKKQEEKQAAAAATDGSKKKKGIPALSSRMYAEEPAAPVDDVDFAARLFDNQGGEDDLLLELGDDDMFDFSGEDISDLM